MRRIGTAESARSNRRRLTLEGTSYWKSDFVVSTEPARPAPQAFLIEQDPGSTFRSHFHTEDQFQVVVAGGGTLGRHAVAPLTVHYAGRDTGYGPIVAGPQGLSYFSLRPMTTVGAHWLPESRERMRELPRRHVLGRRVPDAGGAQAAPGAAASQAAIDPQPDGLAAWWLRVPPAGAVAAPVHPGGAERFVLVTAGTLRRHGEAVAAIGLVFETADEAGAAFEAGPDGAEVLVMQFPGSPWSARAGSESSS